MNADTYVEMQALVDTEWVAAHLHDPGLRIFDCTLLLAPTAEDPFRFETVDRIWPRGHLPGAGFLDLKVELSDPLSRWPLQFTMPRSRQFAEVLGRKGVGEDTRVVLYSAQHPMCAARVWWMLRTFGFDNACVMDGGWEKWVAEGRPVSTEPCGYAPAQFHVHHRGHLVASKAEVRAAIGNPKVLLINALSRKQHAGEGVNYGRPGRIPGSVCVPAAELVTRGTGTLRPIEELRALFESAGVRRGLRLITYCGGGIAAACEAFVLSLLGYGDVAVYDGSLAEWSNDPTLPLEIG